MNGTRPPRIPRDDVDEGWTWTLLAMLLICVALVTAGVWLGIKVLIWIASVVGWWLG